MINRFNIYLVFLIILVAGLLFAAAAQKSFWEDETMVAYFEGSEDLAASIQRITWDVHPPLMLYVLGTWGKVFGYHELGLRSLPILFSILTLIFTYYLSKELFNRKTALITVTILGFSPFFIMYGHIARYYSFAAALSVLAAFSMVRFKGLKNAVFLLIYVLSCIVLLYLLFAGVTVIIACNLWWFFYWLSDKNRSKSLLFTWIIAQIIILFAYFPGLNLFSNTVGLHPEILSISNLLLEAGKRSGFLGYVFGVGPTISPLNPVAWIGIFIILIIAVFAILTSFKNVNFWLPVIFLLVIGGINLVISFNAFVSVTWQGLPYRMFYAFPFLSIWLGVGIVKMRPKFAWVSFLLVIFVCLVGQFNYFTNRQFLVPGYTVPWRSIFSGIQDNSSPESVVICSHGDTSCNYYAELYGFGNNFPADWSELSEVGFPPELWWIQTNLGTQSAITTQDNEVFDELSNIYQYSQVVGFAEQDSSIRWLKENIFNLNDYQFRVEVIKFYNPK